MLDLTEHKEWREQAIMLSERTRREGGYEISNVLNDGAKLMATTVTALEQVGEVMSDAEQMERSNDRLQQRVGEQDELIAQLTADLRDAKAKLAAKRKAARVVAAPEMVHPFGVGQAAPAVANDMTFNDDFTALASLPADME